MADKYNQNRIDVKNARLAKGLCRDCGLLPFTVGKTVCKPCFEKRQTETKARSNKAKQLMVCVSCFEPSEGKSLCKACMGLQVERMRQRRKTNKETVVNYFGGKCLFCNENHIACLTLDHINNNGNTDQISPTTNKRIHTTEWYARLAKAIKENNQWVLQGLQLLCFNCHAKKDLMPWWMKEEQT